MSYEGYDQLLCSEGHYSTRDCFASWEDPCFCGAKIVWENVVDQTNGGDQGYIDMKQFEIVPAVSCTCRCGNIHTKERARYRIPIAEETRKAQEFDEDI